MAFLLDTNVLSEVRKKNHAHPAVMAWYAGVQDNDLFLSTLTIGEVRRGVELRRRRDPVSAGHLERWLEGIVRWFEPRLLPVTTQITNRWGSLCLDQPVAAIDGLLAATALHHGLVFVTRNVEDVARTGVQILNPFGDSM